MFAQVTSPALYVVPALPDIAPTVGHFVLLQHKQTQEERIVEVWTFTDSFADVCKELDNVRDDLSLSKAEWSFYESWEIDAPF